MLRTLRAGLLITALLSFFAAPLLSTQPAHALFDNAKQNACTGINTDGTDACASATGASGLSGTLSNVINILSLITGVAAVIMIIIGGLMFITSGGDPNGTKTARSTVIYALVGLAITALAQFLVHFVLSKT